MKTFNKTFILFTLLYVLFFVKTWGSVSGNIYSHDDVVYYAQTASLVNDFDIDIKNNLGQYSNIYLGISPKTGRMMSYQPLGPTLLYLIPYAATKPFALFISMMRGVAFDQFDPLFFVVLCFFTLVLFYFSGLFIYKALRLFFEERIADITTVLTLWGTILPVYVFRRPIFGVIPEFFSVSLFVYYIARIYKENSISISKSTALGAILGFLIITRWNDLYLLMFCFVFMFCFALRKCNFQRGISCFTVFIFFLGIFLALQAAVWVKTYGNLKDFFGYYYQLHAQFISSKNTISAYLRNFLHIIFGLDWGVLFTMPVLFFGGITLIVNPKLRILKYKILDIMLFLLIFWASFHVVLQWKNTGEFYGYRFLISLLPFSAIGFATLSEKLWEKYGKIIKRLVLIFCFFNFLILLPFELIEKTSLSANNITPMGGMGWGNNAYFINALRFYFTCDIKTFISVFLRGYLAASVFSIISLLGIDLIRFGDKVKNYYTLSGYRLYLVFLYPVFVGIWFLFLGTGKGRARK